MLPPRYIRLYPDTVQPHIERYLIVWAAIERAERQIALYGP